jgi:hypothetical protein
MKKQKNKILFSKLWPCMLLFPLFFMANLMIVQNLDNVEDSLMHALG